MKHPKGTREMRQILNSHPSLRCFVVASFAAAMLLALPGFPLEPGWDPFIEMRVPVPPQPFAGNGKVHLAYELHLTNLGPEAMTLEKIEVIGEGSEEPLASYREASLRGMLQRFGTPEEIKETTLLAPGARAAAFIWITRENAGAVPAALSHRLTVRPKAEGEGEKKEKQTEKENEKEKEKEKEKEEEEEKKDAEAVTMTGSKIEVDRRPPVVLAPPLKGEGWFAANGPMNMSGHRRALIAVGGRAAVAQRFAIDYVQLFPGGPTWKDDRLKNANYSCYGAEALAVADGVVAAALDGVPENVPGITSRAQPITLENVGGNYVILDLGEGRFAFYAHLQPGSLKVKVGDAVKTGQALGLVGNSGNSTEPHLHFHVSDSPSPLGAEGIPYAIDSFEVLKQNWHEKKEGEAADIRKNEIPMANAILRFAGRQP